MKINKKILIPILSSASIVAIIAPSLTSCSGIISFEWAYNSGKQYVPSTDPYESESPTMNPERALETYFQLINKNKKILLDDFVYSVITDKAKQENMMYVGMWIGDIDPAKHTASFDWKVQYLSAYPVATTCIYDVNVKVTNLPFEAWREIPTPPVSPDYDKGVCICPIGLHDRIDLKADRSWNIDYFFQETSPLGVAKRTYYYNAESLNKGTYPEDALFLYVLPSIAFNSRFFQNIKLTY